MNKLPFNPSILTERMIEDDKNNVIRYMDLNEDRKLMLATNLKQQSDLVTINKMELNIIKETMEYLNPMISRSYYGNFQRPDSINRCWLKINSSMIYWLNKKSPIKHNEKEMIAYRLTTYEKRDTLQRGAMWQEIIGNSQRQDNTTQLNNPEGYENRFTFI